MKHSRSSLGIQLLARLRDHRDTDDAAPDNQVRVSVDVTGHECYPLKSNVTVSANEDPAILPQSQSPLELPAGVALTLRLQQPISIGGSAASDELVARLDKAVKSGTVSLPKGTPVLGRIRRLEPHSISLYRR